MVVTEEQGDGGCLDACSSRLLGLSIYCRGLQRSGKEVRESVGLVWRTLEVPARPASLCCSMMSQASAVEENIDGCLSVSMNEHRCEASGAQSLRRSPLSQT